MARQSDSEDVWVIPIAADAYIREAWATQEARALSTGTSGELMSRLVECVESRVDRPVYARFRRDHRPRRGARSQDLHNLDLTAV